MPSLPRTGVLLVTLLAAASGASADIVYAVSGRCVVNELFGASSESRFCPSAVTGQVRINDAYVPGSTVDQTSGLPAPVLTLDGIFDGSPPSPFWSINLPLTAGVLTWVTGNTSAVTFSALAGDISWQSEWDGRGTFWRFLIQDVTVMRQLPLPSSLALSAAALAGLALSARRQAQRQQALAQV